MKFIDVPLPPLALWSNLCFNYFSSGKRTLREKYKGEHDTGHKRLFVWALREPCIA